MADRIERTTCSRGSLAVTAVLAVSSLALAWHDTWTVVAISLIAAGIALGCFRPPLSIAVLVATYPILDFTPWAGQWVVRHHDFLVLGVCCGWWLHRSRAESRDPILAAFKSWTEIYTAWVIVTTVIGATFLSSIADPGAMLHLAPANAFRVAKGIGLAWLVVVSYPRTKSDGTRYPELVTSMSAGAPWALIYVGGWCLLERGLFVGWSDWTSTFRVAGPMSGAMNLGGQNLEGVLLVLLPLCVLAWQTSALKWQRVLVLMGSLLGVISLLLTLTRSVIAVLVLIVVLTVATTILRSRAKRYALIWLVAGTAAIATMITAIVMFPALRSRFDETSAAWQLRKSLYRTALEIVSDKPFAWVIGTGSGTFPTLYARHQREHQPSLVPGYFFVTDRDGKESLSIHAGRLLFLGKQVDHTVGSAATVRVRLRSQSPTRVPVFLCEKTLFNSVACRTASLPSDGDGNGNWVEAALDGDPLGEPLPLLASWSVRHPLNVSIGTTNDEAGVEIESIQLLSSDGKLLWQQERFQPGLTDWLITTDFYQPFHVENNLLHVWIEQGLVGVLLLSITVFMAIKHVLSRSDPTVPILLAIIIGPLVAGMLNSTLDTPEPAAIWLIPVFAFAIRKPAE